MTKEFIDNAIQNAVEGKSNLTQDILNVRGFSTPTIRHLFNNLCNIEGTYLEVGLFCGASFCASFNKNCTAIGIEDHSQDFSEGFEKVKEELKDNLRMFKYRAKEVQVHYADCFSIDKSLLPDNINIYSYDGWHSEEHQTKALPYFFDKMADKFIWIIDDINWDYVWTGTNNGLIQLRDYIEVEHCRVLRGYQLQNDPIFHNGVAIYLINKKK